MNKTDTRKTDASKTGVSNTGASNISGKIDARSNPARSRTRSPLLDTLSVRLLLLLLLAEIPLVIFTVAIALQNDRLRASDALSQAISLQRAALAQTNHDLRIAAALATASGILPPDVLRQPGDCNAILNTLIAPNADRVAQAAFLAPDGTQRCGSRAAAPPGSRPGWVHSILTSPTALSLVLDQHLIHVGYRLSSGGATYGAIVIQLVSDRGDMPGAPNMSALAAPWPSLWLLRAGLWLPIDDAPDGATPAAPLAPHPGDAPQRSVSRDGRAYLYSAMPLDGSFGQPGAMLVAASDVRAAVLASNRTFMLRLLEMAFFFVCEFLLIVAGVRQAVTQPLKQLSDAVQSWREDGVFSAAGMANDPSELRDLTASFTTATQSLNQRERELRSAIVQQDLLMKEIHHRVKNNMQIVASLLNLQASRIQAPEARAEFQSARDRVRALATLHRHLYADGELHMIDMRAFFAELCSQLFQALGEAEGDRIGVKVTAPDINISSDQAVPIALIVTETVGNAIKYAFPEGRRGMISVSLEVGADDVGTLTVRDDGVGMAEPDPRDARRGLGMQLVRGFARQLGATLTVTHDHGTCYHVALKLERQRRYDDGMAAAPDAAMA